MANVEKKRKWERDYENYANSTELDERIEYLTDLTNGKVAMKEEYDELKKLTAIKTNLPKVKNILELRGKLEEQRKELETVIQGKERFEKLQKATEILDKKMKALEAEYKDLQEQLKNPKLKPQEKVELQNKVKENEKARQENNIKFGNFHEEIKNYKEEEKFKDMSIDDVKKECTQISMNISKCNLACNKLMKGYSWESVEVALNKYEAEKLTAKGENATKIKQNREAAKAEQVKSEAAKAENAKAEQVKSEVAKAENENAEPVKSNTESKKTEQVVETTKEEKEEEKALVVPTRWQKIKGWAKNWFEKWFVEDVEEKEVEEVKEVKSEKDQGDISKKKSLIARLKDAFNKFMEKEEAVEETTKNEPSKQEEAKSEEIKQEEPAKTETKQDAFRQYLREVAEKGIDGVEQEKAEIEKADKEARRQAAIEKLKANRAGKDTGAIITKLDKELSGQDDAR